jgi:hypothetical protein
MQTIDSTVTKRKFEQELNTFLAGRESYRKRGILLLDATYPNIFVGFCVAKLRPPVIAFAISVNFDNFDFEPLSIEFVDPFSFAPAGGFPLLRRLDGTVQPQNLTQQDTSGRPFICIPGTREYHNHPAHTGDSWLLHRKKGGEGSLGFLLEKIYEYGIPAIANFQFQVQVNTPQLLLAHDPSFFSL